MAKKKKEQSETEKLAEGNVGQYDTATVDSLPDDVAKVYEDRRQVKAGTEDAPELDEPVDPNVEATEQTADDEG